jgi:hypothetical protein
MRDQAGKVGRLGEGYRDILWELHELGRFTRRPCAKHLALGIVELSGDRMLSPQARAVRSPVALVRFLAARHVVPMGIERPSFNN